MKFEKLETAKTFLAVQMDYWIVFSVALTACLLQGERMQMLRFGLLSLYPFVLYLIRRNSSSFFSFTGLHFLLAAGLMLLPAETVFIRGLFDGYVLAYTACSFYLRMNTRNWQDKAIPPMLAVGILVLMQFVLRLQGQEAGRETYFIVIATGYFILYFLYSYLVQYLHFITVNESSAGYIPVRKMFKAGLGMTIPYSITCGILLLFIGHASLIVDIANGIKRLLIWILSLFLRHAGTEEGYVPEETVVQAEELLQTGGALFSGESFWLWDVFEKLCMLAVALLLMAAVYVAGKALVRYVRKAFGRKGRQYEEAAEELVDRRERCEIEEEGFMKNKKHMLSFLSNRERIRRIYRKKIISAKKASHSGRGNGEPEVYLKESSTARECCGRLQADALAEVYEKARYSELSCSSADWKEARKWQ